MTLAFLSLLSLPVVSCPVRSPHAFTTRRLVVLCCGYVCPAVSAQGEAQRSATASATGNFLPHFRKSRNLTELSFVKRAILILRLHNSSLLHGLTSPLSILPPVNQSHLSNSTQIPCPPTNATQRFQPLPRPTPTRLPGTGSPHAQQHPRSRRSHGCRRRRNRCFTTDDVKESVV